MTDWLDFETAVLAVADRSFHAGLVAEILRGDQECSYEQSVFDLCSLPHGPNPEIEQVVASATTWTWLDDMQPLWVPLRRARGGGWRSLRVEAEGAVSAGTVDIYFCLRRSPTFIGASALPFTGGCTLSFAAVNYLADDAQIDHGDGPAPEGLFGADNDATLAFRAVGGWLMAAAYCSAAGATVSLRGLRLTEVLP